MRTRKLVVVALAIAASLVVAACGDDDDGDKGNSGGKTADKKLSGSINVWIMQPGSPKLEGIIKGYATDFSAKNPGTKISVSFVPWNQAHDKFTTAIAGGKVPDAAEIGTTWTPEFADQGAFTEVPKPPAGQYVSSLVDASTLDGKVYGKPWYAGSRALIYRKDYFKKAGIDAPPKNWDELMADAKKLKSELPDVFPFAANGLSEHYYLPYIWQAGGEIATQDAESWKAAMNSPEGAKAIDFYTSFYKQELTPKAAVGWEEPDSQEAFINGDVAMLIAGGWTYTSIIDTKKSLESKIGVTLQPAGPSGKDTAFAGGSHLSVFKESKNPELATAFVDFMLTPDNLNKFTSAIGFLPGTVAGIEASGYLDDATRKPFAEQLLEHSAVYPPSPRWGALEGANIFDGEIQKTMRGRQSAQDAAKNMAEKMDEELAG